MCYDCYCFIYICVYLRSSKFTDSEIYHRTDVALLVPTIWNEWQIKRNIIKVRMPCMLVAELLVNWLARIGTLLLWLFYYNENKSPVMINRYYFRCKRKSIKRFYLLGCKTIKSFSQLTLLILQLRPQLIEMND